MAKINAILVYATSIHSQSKDIIAKFEVGSGNEQVALELVNNLFPNQANFYIPYNLALDLWGDATTLKEIPTSNHKLPFHQVEMTWHSPEWEDEVTHLSKT